MSDCDAIREMLVENARGASVDRTLSAHLDACPACRRRLANERMLSAGLAAISSHAVPPAAVRNAVLAEFRRAKKPVPIRRPLVVWFAIGAAAVILLAVFLTSKHRPQTIVTTAVQDPVPVHMAPKAPVVTAQAPTPVKRHRAAKVQTPPAAEPARSSEEVATDFFELPYSEPLRPEERVDVFRVQMPRANMAVFGLPVAGGRLDSRVTADVLVGEDGVMRAIRFIR